MTDVCVEGLSEGRLFSATTQNHECAVTSRILSRLYTRSIQWGKKYCGAVEESRAHTRTLRILDSCCFAQVTFWLNSNTTAQVANSWPAESWPPAKSWPWCACLGGPNTVVRFCLAFRALPRSYSSLTGPDWGRFHSLGPERGRQSLPSRLLGGRGSCAEFPAAMQDAHATTIAPI